MPASAPYIPQTDAGLQAWAVNFDAIVAVDFASLGVTAPEAAAITAATATYVASLALASDPLTRTSVTVAQKNTDKFALLALVRPIAQRIAIDPAILDATKISLGLNPHTSVPVPIAAPTSFPLLDILKATPGEFTMQYRDSDTPTVKAKPYGVVHMELWAACGTAFVPTPVGLDYMGPRTKAPFIIEFSPGDVGKVATVYGRWVNRNGLVGPWSSGVALTVAF